MGEWKAAPTWRGRSEMPAFSARVVASAMAARAGEDALFRRVVVGDADALDPVDELFEGFAGRAGGGHGAEVSAGPGLDHEAATGAADTDQVRAGQDPGGVERGKFAIAVPAGHVGREAHVGEDGPETGLDRAERGLGDVGGGQGLRGGGKGRVIIGPGGQNQARERFAKGGVGLGQALGHRGEERGEVGQHVGVLAALSGEDEGEFALVEKRSLGEGRAGGQGARGVGEMGRQRGDAVGQRFRPRDDQRGGEAVRGTGGGERGGEGGEVRAVACQPVGLGLDLGGEGRAGGRAPEEELVAPPGAGGGLERGDGALTCIFLERDVEVGAAEAEGRDTRPAGRVGGREPGGGTVHQIEGDVGVVQPRVRRAATAMGRQDGVVDGHRRLDEAAIPAAALVWPISVLTEPMADWRGAAPASVRRRVTVVISEVSPATVPVPCASKRPTVAGE